MGSQYAEIRLGEFFYGFDGIEPAPHQFREFEQEFGIQLLFSPGAPLLERDVNRIGGNGDQDRKNHDLIKTHLLGGCWWRGCCCIICRC